MTDRELLEAAAEAAGHDALTWYEWMGESGMIDACDPDCGYWNPLTDDGDALRLAVALRINIEHMKTLAGADFGINCWPVGRGDCGVSQDDDLTDYNAATRRAIVRAAAALATSPR